MHFIYSEDYFLLSKATNKLVKFLNKDQQAEIHNFSLIEDSFNEIVETITTISIFAENKIVILKDAWFVNEDKVNLNKDFSLEKLEFILKNPNPNVEIIFTLNSGKFSKKLKIAKRINELAKVEHIAPMTEDTIKKYIKTFMVEKEGKEISDKLINFIFMNLPHDMLIINNELNKLSKIDQPLTENIIKDTLTKYLEADIFELSNAFIKNDIEKFLKLYRDYLLLNDDIFGLINLILANISFTRDVLVMRGQGKSQATIAELLKAHPYRVKLACEINNIKIKQLNDKIKLLYKIQKGIISDQIDKEVITEYEFVKIMR
ncbi:DNA polymerase III subunit delta [[Acholeplasma] multilocale]|uniref:DNA polymerase III subunit delta n=1 Tax=[Acholeplasma] multilocale TaxID=264638 RepID=UPI000479936A|nr:DNA polymerase III subunit delta [[Acholeplasma] multilocale]